MNKTKLGLAGIGGAIVALLGASTLNVLAVDVTKVSDTEVKVMESVETTYDVNDVKAKLQADMAQKATQQNICNKIIGQYDDKIANDQEVLNKAASVGVTPN